MSTFSGCLLSTSFRVKNGKGFLADPEVKFIKDYALRNEGFFESDDDNYFAFGWKGDNPDNFNVWWDEANSGFYPSPKDGDEVTPYLAEVIHRHILPGDVCQIGISGNERLSAIGGTITWVTSKGILSFNGFTPSESKYKVGWLKHKFEELTTEVASIV